MNKSTRVFSVILALLGLGSLPLMTYALATVNSTYIVDRLTDGNPTGGGEGTGLSGDLRYAIAHAQTDDHITFSVTGTINLGGILPSLTHNISIDGPGANLLVVHGAGGSVFGIGSNTTIVISGLTITGGVGNGGGILNAGTLTLDNCAISGNLAGDPTNGGGTGAGIWNYIDAKLTLNNSTISGNSAIGNLSYSASRGGGIANYGILTLNNSTVSGNSATQGFGGGISNSLNTSTLTLNNSTVSDNSATGGGGGIDNRGSFNAVNTIVAGNDISSPSPDLLGRLTSSGHNLIGNTTGGSGFRPDLGDLLNVNPLLGFLQNNGGPTETHGLLPGSPAIDAGDNAICPSTDQRGVARSQGGQCDIGAYELLHSSLTVLSIIRDGPNPTLDANVNFTVTFSERVTGVDVSDFALTTIGVSDASITGVSGSGEIRTVSVSTGSGYGTIRLDVVDDDSIVDAAANPLGGIGIGNGNFMSGAVYTINGYTISGNAGSDGVTLTYIVDGVTKTAISDINGNYSFRVPAGWSGIVTPSK